LLRSACSVRAHRSIARLPKTHMWRRLSSSGDRKPFRKLQDSMEQCTINSWCYLLAGGDGAYGVALAMRGEIGAAIRWLAEAISRREQEGYRSAADWYRMFLCEIYLEVISSKEKPSATVLFRNARTLASIIFWGSKAHLNACSAHSAKPPIGPKWASHRPMRDDPRPALQGQREARARP